MLFNFCFSTKDKVSNFREKWSLVYSPLLVIPCLNDPTSQSKYFSKKNFKPDCDNFAITQVERVRTLLPSKQIIGSSFDRQTRLVGTNFNVKWPFRIVSAKTIFLHEFHRKAIQPLPLPTTSRFFSRTCLMPLRFGPWNSTIWRWSTRLLIFLMQKYRECTDEWTDCLMILLKFCQLIILLRFCHTTLSVLAYF